MKKYVIITPAKNEALYIRQTIDSVISQTILPYKWIIVDDGSSDKTDEIIESYTPNYPWIYLLKIKNQEEKRSGGSKVIKAFNEGYRLIKEEKFDIIVKLDADLILPVNYFEKIFEIFKDDSKVGLAGGLILNKFGDRLKQEGKLDYHVRGAFKTYKRECFEEIGGFRPIWNWDGLDEMEIMYNGWKTKTIDLKVIHLRPTTSAYNLRAHAYKSGFEAYRLRMNLLLMFVRVVKKLGSKPLILYGLYYMFGFVSAWVSGSDRLINKDLAAFINNFHFNRILKDIGFKRI